MSSGRGWLCGWLFILLLVGGTGPHGAWAAEDSCAAAMAKVAAQNSKLSGELRRIQREIAALRADFDRPGMEEVFAGLGYILGLFGTAAFVASRRKG